MNKIFCLGEILWDILPSGKFIGGAPFNAAFHLMQHNIRVGVISRVGNDKDGADIKGKLKSAGMDTATIQTDQNMPTGRVEVSLNNRGEAEYEILTPAAWDFIEISSSLQTDIGKSSAIIFGSLAQRSSVSYQSIQRILNSDVLKVFDINLRFPHVDPEKIEESLFRADIVKLNEIELDYISGLYDFPLDIPEALNSLARKFACPRICLTLGEKGAMLLDSGQIYKHSGFSVDVADTVGSGDAFLAAFVAGYLGGLKGNALLAKSNAAGAFVATQNGATPRMDFAQIDAILKNKTGA